MNAIYHEVGHWLVADALGYKGMITGNLKENTSFGFTLLDKIENNERGLKHQLAIAFGGKAAEEILNLPPNAGYIGDLQIACLHLKQLKEIKGEKFEFKNYLDFSENELEKYLQISKSIIQKLGGRELIIENGNYVFNRLKN